MFDAAFVGNEGWDGGGAVFVAGEDLVAETCDFDANRPEDVWSQSAGLGYDWGEGASFTCDETGCY